MSRSAFYTRVLYGLPLLLHGFSELKSEGGSRKGKEEHNKSGRRGKALLREVSEHVSRGEKKKEHNSTRRGGGKELILWGLERGKNACIGRR